MVVVGFSKTVYPKWDLNLRASPKFFQATCAADTETSHVTYIPILQEFVLDSLTRDTSEYMHINVRPYTKTLSITLFYADKP